MSPLAGTASRSTPLHLVGAWLAVHVFGKSYHGRELLHVLAKKLANSTDDKKPPVRVNAGQLSCPTSMRKVYKRKNGGPETRA